MTLMHWHYDPVVEEDLIIALHEQHASIECTKTTSMEKDNIVVKNKACEKIRQIQNNL